jgi:hypothetical protein
MNVLRKEIDKIVGHPIGRKMYEWELTPMVTVRAGRPEFPQEEIVEVFRIEILLGIEAALGGGIDLTYAKQDLYERLSRYLYSGILDALLELRGEILKDISRDKAIKMINEIMDMTR